MKRLSNTLILVTALALAGCASTNPTPQIQTNNQFFTNAACSSYDPSGMSGPPLKGAICSDTGSGALYVWNGTAFAAATSGLAAPGAIGGTTPAAITGTTITGNTALISPVVTGGKFNTSATDITPPTSGTGSVTSGSTNSVMEVTGGTSPVTVTFGTAFTNKPFCVCGDETSATGVCKVVPNANGATAVVTTAGTDSFVLVCVGNAA